MGKTAILLGATGLTGGYLLKCLLNDSRYETVILFNRRSIGTTHHKQKELIVDLLSLDTQKEYFIADEVFCCIGTTAKKTPDKMEYRAIDYGIPVMVSKLAKANAIPSLLVMSSLGADKTSRAFYTKIKGEMEAAVLSQNIKHTYILQPSLIGGTRNESRLGESIGKAFMKLIDPLLIGGLKKYRIIHPKTIAEAMLFLANSNRKSGIYPSNQLKEFAEE